MMIDSAETNITIIIAKGSCANLDNLIQLTKKAITVKTVLFC